MVTKTFDPRTPPAPSNWLSAMKLSLHPRFGTWHDTILLIGVYAGIVSVVFMWQESPPISSYRPSVSDYSVRAGQIVTVTAETVRDKSGCDSVVEREWLDPSGNVIDAEQFYLPPLPRGTNTIVRQAQVPPQAKPGILRMQVNVMFQCNIVQELVGGQRFVLPDVYFLVEDKL